MAKPIRGRDGKFQGSIGNGRTRIPSSSSLPVPSPSVEAEETDPLSYDDLYDKYTDFTPKKRSSKVPVMIRTQGNKVLFNRLGGLNSYPQETMKRAPLSHGTWAFPWPAFEMFFAYHQYEHAMPKLLHGEPAPRMPTEEEFYADDYAWDCRQDLWEKKSEWVQKIGKKAWKIRDFWYSGNLYTHIRPNGEILGLDEWVRMPARGYAEAVRRSGYLNTFYRDREGHLHPVKYSADHLEVFLADKI